MQDLDGGVARFHERVLPRKAGLFQRLATHHAPHTLFISCSDARVVPELITQSEPGELFVIRTAGNIVPVYRGDADGVAASIEYAVTALGVSTIVVCGHSACGAMTAVATGADLAAMPSVAAWLGHVNAANADGESRAAAVAALVRDNVAEQLDNLLTHPSVARAVADSAVEVRGWVYDIATGSVSPVEPASALTV
ncbi:carbonic anhydrase [Nocardia cyriacigeorgica]|uniref:Carbonic anhydrase n=1 Tax=Nocardia cyriacigeorgica TaxID=135487 RepID=A0A6P1D2Z3_9NOCA|nr:carbonic anhydrase [Nocardia cyriacigeorgica]NEW37741.1 carbonic anhydrase [Nocardia cyriacigeorgica]NEW43333.1 carbonic anhydrase [Nocardia cyriacigeorgica]NEW56123.1 carbonic anhydrase [Nocardia cyriacigeorgica]